MAKFLPGPTVAAVSGSIGGTVYSHNRFGMYMRNRSKPVVSTTEKAIAAKALFSAASQAWQALAIGIQQAWNMWANGNPIVGSLGQPQNLTGHAAFSGNYCVMTKLGQATLTSPPITPAPTPLTAVSVLASKTLGTADVTFLATPLGAGTVLWFRGCYVASAGKHYIQNLLRWCPISAVAPASPYDAFANFETALGTMTIGHRLVLNVSVADQATGLLSQPLRCEDTIV